MASTLTLLGESLALDFLFDTTAVTRATTWFQALHVGANGGAGAANELSGNGYARQAVTYTRTGNVISNSTATTFGPCTTAPWGTVTDMTIWDSATGGRCLAQGTTAVSVTYAVGDSATVAIGAQTVTLV
jgi:hypothetical protein